MKNGLKQALVKKLEVTPSETFDAQFFEKLEVARRPGVFSNWITWMVSGLATASVLFISINSFNSPHNLHRSSFNHREYVESVLEIQQSMTEEISNDDMIDLTTLTADEI
jgi:hypothetical protein